MRDRRAAAPGDGMNPDHLFFFGGCDPAPSESARSDDGTISILAAHPRIPVERDQGLSKNPTDWYTDFILAERYNHKEKLSARQWSGILHKHHRRFRLQKLVIDPNGGGIYVKRELPNEKQLIDGSETTVVPIGDLKDDPKKVPHGDFILHMFKRGDVGVEAVWPGLAGDEKLNDAIYGMTKDRLEGGGFAWPPKFETVQDSKRSELEMWIPEKVEALKILAEQVDQFGAIQVEKNGDGTDKFTMRNARNFYSTGKKDMVSSAMYAYAGFLIWLTMEGFEAPRNGEDQMGFMM
jgi:hypothetical protein